MESDSSDSVDTDELPDLVKIEDPDEQASNAEEQAKEIVIKFGTCCLIKMPNR